MTEVLHIKPPCEDSIIGFGASEAEWEESKAYLRELQSTLGCKNCVLDCPVRGVLEITSYEQFRSLVNNPVLP